MTNRPNPDNDPSITGAFEASSDAIVTLSESGEILSWNGGAERLFGFGREEAVGRSIYRLLVPQDRFEETRSAIQAARQGRPVVYEAVRCRKDSSRVTVQISERAIPPAPGGPGQIISVLKGVREVAARRPADESDVKFRGLIESVPDATVLFNREGRIVLVNTRTEKLFGYSREELATRPIDLLVPDCFVGGIAEGGTTSGIFRSERWGWSASCMGGTKTGSKRRSPALSVLPN